MCENSSKTTERCATSLTSSIRWCSVICLHKRVRLNWTTTHCRCILDDNRMKLFHQLNIYGTSLDDRSGSGMTSITSWMHNNCNQISIVVAQMLISSMMRRCVGACGVLRRSYQILSNDVTFEARPLCNLTRYTALWKSDIPKKIRHYDC